MVCFGWMTPKRERRGSTIAATEKGCEKMKSRPTQKGPVGRGGKGISLQNGGETGKEKKTPEKGGRGISDIRRSLVDKTSKKP